MTRWTARQVAEAAGIAPQSGRDLVRQLGLATVDRDLVTGAKLYDAAQAEAALYARPGRGSRTDLGRMNRPLTPAEERRTAEWAATAARAEQAANTTDDPRARALLLDVADQLARLRRAAVRFPLFAMHPNPDNAHSRLYDVAAELARMTVPAVRNAEKLGTDHSWDEAHAVRDRVIELVDLAVAGRPFPS